MYIYHPLFFYNMSHLYARPSAVNSALFPSYEWRLKPSESAKSLLPTLSDNILMYIECVSLGIMLVAIVNLLVLLYPADPSLAVALLQVLGINQHSTLYHVVAMTSDAYLVTAPLLLSSLLLCFVSLVMVLFNTFLEVYCDYVCPTHCTGFNPDCKCSKSTVPPSNE